MKENILTRPEDSGEVLPGPWPWYVLLFTGFALTGFIPWLMVNWALYQRARRPAAIISFALNFAVFVFFTWSLAEMKVPWWQLMSLAYLFNVAWAFTAWVFQRRLMGSARRRYIPAEWKSWITPLLIGAIIGVCVATVFSIGPAFENRVEMRAALDTLDRKTILWDFFQYWPLGLLGGLFVGFWWAGEGRRFKTSSVITFLSAFALLMALWPGLGFLVIFLIHKGAVFQNAFTDASGWALIPPWVGGFKGYLLQVQAFNISALLVVPLLLGSVAGLRDFGKRVVIVPLSLFCVLPLLFTENEWWNAIQDQIVYEMSSPDDKTRKSAHEWAEIILNRYPNHLQWPRIAENLARYYYKEGDYESSQALYRKIIERYSDSNRWHWVSERAVTALRNPHFGKPLSLPDLKIPMVDYEEYLTHNWMTLLSVIRFWEGPEIPESKVKIALKDLSQSHERILLSPLVHLAGLDDAARGLGYEVLILPAEISKVKALILNKIPVIHQCYAGFNLLFGFDESRSALSAYSFSKLSKRLRRESRKEAKEILSIEDEGRGESKKRLDRIANQVYGEYSMEYWESSALSYGGPLMAIVFPPEKFHMIARSLAADEDALRMKSKGYLATLIGLSYLNHADPVRAVEWAKIGVEKTGDPMPLYVAHMARVFWESRSNRVRSNVPLHDQFPELAHIFNYFHEPENLTFLKRARQHFEADLEADTLPKAFLDIYIPLLDRSDPADLNMIIKATRGRLSTDPTQYECWRALADSYEWAEDIPGMVGALQGVISSDPLDHKAKLRLAYGYVLIGKYADAKAVLDETDLNKVRYDADHLFCMGALAEWKGNTKEALKIYKKAVEMRRYKPVYHLRYGKLLLKEGFVEEAGKALQWAARIDGGHKVKQEAEKILSKMGG